MLLHVELVYCDSHYNLSYLFRYSKMSVPEGDYPARNLERKGRG